MISPPTPGVLGRTLRPAAWWLWAAGVALAAAATSNPLLLPLLALATGYVVAARRCVGRPATPYRLVLQLTPLAVLVGIAVEMLLHGAGRQTLLAGFEQGMRPAVGLLSIGAALSLSRPARMPGWLPVLRLAVAAHLLPAYRRVQVVRELRPEIGPRSLLRAALRTAVHLARQQCAALGERGRRAGAGTVERWHAGEWFAVTAGAGIACCFGLCAFLGSALTPDPWTLQAPTIPAVAALGLLLSVLPAHLTPAPPRPAAPHAAATHRLVTS